MAKYIVVHTPVAEEATQDTLFKAVQAVAMADAPDTEWLGSWLAVDASKMFCLWNAPDEDAIRAALGEVLKIAPIEAIYEVVELNPKDFR